MHRFRDEFLALILGVLAFVLRVYNFRHGEPPSIGEIVATLDALSSPAVYLQTLQLDLCPPLYYIVLKPLTAFGSSLWLMRLPSLLIGLVTPSILFLLFRRRAGRLASFLAGLLLALSPLHVFYSQQAEPLALTIFLICFILYIFIHFDSPSSLRLWVAYDIAMIALLHSHREAAFVAVTFLLMHLLRAWWLKRVPQAFRQNPVSLTEIWANHLLIAILAFPWLAIMPTKAEWYEPRPSLLDFLRVWAGTLLLGKAVSPPDWWWAMAVVFYLSLAPAFGHLFHRKGGVGKSALVGALCVTALPLVWSFMGRTRFQIASTPALTLPFFCLLLGELIAHSKKVIRVLAIAFAAGVMFFGSIQQCLVKENPSYDAVARAIEKNAAPGSVVVTWPDFADRVSLYFLGENYKLVAASEFFEKWVQPAPDQPIYLAVYHFPTREAHPYTFVGALTQFANTRLLYREKLNMAFESRHLDMLSLRLWFEDPETLNIVDQPTSTTLFLFTPTDRIFRSSEFIRDNPAFGYDFSGQRCVWLAKEQVLLPLQVTLGPGHYIVRLHGSTSFECADTGCVFSWKSKVLMRIGDEQVQREITGEGYLELPLEVESEMRTISLLIAVDRTQEVNCNGESHRLALKIYSIAIEAGNQSIGKHASLPD